MAECHLRREVLRQLCAAAAGECDDPGIPKLLGHRNVSSLSLNEPLLQPNKRANLVRRAAFLSTTSLDLDVRIDLLIRSLLQSPSNYETPWETACAVVTYLSSTTHRWTRSHVQSSVTDIQEFLQQTVAVWWEEERRQILVPSEKPIRSAARLLDGEVLSSETPRSWMLQLLQCVMKPLRHSKESSSTTLNEHWLMTLDLIPLIMSLARDLDSTFFVACLNAVFQEPVRFDVLLPWLNVSSELASYLRDHDMTNVQNVTRQALSSENFFGAAQQDFSDLARVIFSLSVSSMRHSPTISKNVRQWQNLLLNLLSLASQDLHVYSSLETILLSQLSELSSNLQQVWTQCLFDEQAESRVEDIPSWIHCSMLLLILRSTRQSGSQMVSELVAKAFGSSGGQKQVNVKQLCWTRLHSFLDFPSQQTTPQPSVKANDSIDLQQLFARCTYTGGGSFQTSTQKRIDAISKAGSIVYRSIFLSDKNVPSSEALLCLYRGHAWMDAVIDKIKRENTKDNDWNLALAVVIVSVVFVELPSTRPAFMKTFLAAASDTDGSTERVWQVLVATLTLALSSRVAKEELRESSADLNELVNGLPTTKLPLPLLCNLVDSLCTLPSVRQSVADAARRCMQVPSSFLCAGWGRSVKGLQLSNHLDRLKFSIHCLIAVICVPDWGSSELEAWSLLFDILVGRKRIPVEARSWTFERLELQLQSGTVDRSAALHLHRALALRLLVFFGMCETRREVYLPHRLFASWGTGSSRHFHAVEDLYGLVRVVLLLNAYCADKGCPAYTLTVVWRQYLRQLVQDPRAGGECGVKCATETIADFPVSDKHHFQGEVGLATCATMYCVFLLLRFIRAQGSENNSNINQEVDVSVSSLRELLIAQELSALTGSTALPTALEIGSVLESSPLSQLYDEAETAALCHDLCYLLVKFLGGTESMSALSEDHIDPGASLVPEESMRLTRGLALLFLSTSSCHASSPDFVFEDLGSLCEAINTFFHLAIPAIDACIGGEDFISVDNVLAVVLSMCDSVHSYAESRGMAESQELMTLQEVLWMMHSTISDEKATLRLIDCLERASFSAVANQSFRIGEIGSAMLIDRTVHLVRFRVLRALRCCLVIAKPQAPYLEQAFYGVVDEDLPGQSIGVTNWMEALSRDLLEGIKGKSGGLSYELLIVHLDCIDACADRIRARSNMEHKSSYFRRVVGMCTSSRKAIEHVLYTADLKGSLALKKCISLLCYNLPSLEKLALQNMCRLVESYSSEESHVDAPATVRFLGQCRLLLDTKIEFALTKRVVTWKEIVGRSLGREWKDDDHSVSSDSVTSAGTVNPASNPNIIQDTCQALQAENRVLLLQSERVWCWAVSALLQAVEDGLLESLAVIHSCDLNFNSTAKCEAFLRFRINEATAVSAETGALFELTKKESHEVRNVTQLPECMRVVSLPIAAKQRMLSMQERCLVLLQKSVLEVIRFIRRPYQAKISYTIAFIEGFSYFVSWTKSGPTRDPGGCLLNWFVAERNLMSKPHGAVDPSPQSFVQRLQRSLIRAEQLEGSLQRLNQGLVDLDKGTNTKALCARRMVSALSRLLTKVRDHDDNEDSDFEYEDEFSDLVQKKVKELERMRLSQANKDRSKGVGRERGVQDRKRTRFIRSRNDVIDSWLQQDQSIGQDETLEEDAYADLEDFIDGFG